MSKKILIIVVILVVIVGGYFLLKGGYKTPTVPSPEVTDFIPPPETKIPEEETPTPTQVREITVSGTEFSFNPSSITVSAGEKVKITFRNDGKAPHNLIIEGLGIGTKTIAPGQTDTFEFVAPASGTYKFFCSVPGHRSAGMEGSFKVE